MAPMCLKKLNNKHEGEEEKLCLGEQPQLQKIYFLSMIEKMREIFVRQMPPD